MFLLALGSAVRAAGESLWEKYAIIKSVWRLRKKLNELTIQLLHKLRCHCKTSPFIEYQSITNKLKYIFPKTCRDRLFRMSHLCRCIWVCWWFSLVSAQSKQSLSSLRRLIRICKKYAEEFSILFNPGKSKLLCYNLPTDSVPCIKLCGEVVEIVSNKKHLGNKLFNNIYKRDMSWVCGKLL